MIDDTHRGGTGRVFEGGAGCGAGWPDQLATRPGWAGRSGSQPGKNPAKKAGRVGRVGQILLDKKR